MFLKFEFFNRYENKGVQWLKSRPNFPVGLALEEQPKTETQLPGLSAESTMDNLSKAAKKNLKRKEKKKHKALQSNDDAEDDVNDDFDMAAARSIAAVSLQSSQAVQPPTVIRLTPSQDDAKLELTRHVRALRKKLKQIVDLQTKRDSGVKLEPEQLAKIERRKEIEDEIEELQFQLDES